MLWWNNAAMALACASRVWCYRTAGWWLLHRLHRANWGQAFAICLRAGNDCAGTAQVFVRTTTSKFTFGRAPKHIATVIGNRHKKKSSHDETSARSNVFLLRLSLGLSLSNLLSFVSWISSARGPREITMAEQEARLSKT